MVSRSASVIFEMSYVARRPADDPSNDLGGQVGLRVGLASLDRAQEAGEAETARLRMRDMRSLHRRPGAPKAGLEAILRGIGTLGPAQAEQQARLGERRHGGGQVERRELVERGRREREP